MFPKAQLADLRQGLLNGFEHVRPSYEMSGKSRASPGRNVKTLNHW